MEKMMAQDLLSFINKSKSQFHAVKELSDLLEQNGFTYLDENKKWEIQRNQAYYTKRNNSSLIAFKIGDVKEDYSYQMVASHLDSPTFKIKPNSILVRDKYISINTEGYGGMIYSTWLDRPLSLAGRVFTKEGNKVKSHLIDIDRDLLLIPNVAIHMNREINSGFKYNPQIDMLPLFAIKENSVNPLLDLLAEELNVPNEAIINFDLYLYNRQNGCIWGYNEEFISSGRLDDLQCAYPSIRALIDANVDANGISVSVCFDNEEVGSGTMQGAAGNFLLATLEKINHGLGYDQENLYQAFASSLMISADNAHAVHPAHPEYSDQGNRVYMNEGVVIKFHAGQRYTSDGLTSALFSYFCKEANVPYQYYTNRSDKPGGGTLGAISTSQVSVVSVDVGLPQLAMHSSYETAGVKDTYYFYQVLLKVFGSSLFKDEDGNYNVR